MKKHVTPILAGFFLMTLNIHGQSTQKFIDSGSVKTQFDFLMQKSNRYEDYKVVKINWLQQIERNINDTISQARNEIKGQYKTIRSQLRTIDSLKQDLTLSTSKIESLKMENSEINVLGIPFKKTFFTTLFFGVILVLTVFLIIFIMRFKSSNAVTRYTKNSLKELEEEFEEHRKIALEREQKVRRQLQDELNKQKKSE